MASFASHDLDQMLTEARRTLGSMRRTGEPPAESEPVEGVGESPDGRVKAIAVSGGRLKGIELNPRAMRLASEELAELITNAVNAALDDLRGKAADAGTAQAVDTTALAEQVEEVQNQGLRQMEVISQAIQETLGRIGTSR